MKLGDKKSSFHIPEGMIYLDGNSLGPLPKHAMLRVQQMMETQWGDQLIKAWNQSGWMDMPDRIGNRIAPLIGAPPDTVTMGDTLSIKIFQAMAAALRMRPDRKLILSDNGNFPTDLYMVQGLIDQMDHGLIDQMDQGHILKICDPQDVKQQIAEIGSDLACLMLTHVDYRTGRLHDMNKITKLAQDHGAVVIWDLAHSAGALPVEIAHSNAEFAAGCTYKYLNGGPGAPAFIYVRPDIINQVKPVLSGWLGHRAPFDFDLDYKAATGIGRMRVGTPPIIQLAALDAALDIWDGVDLGLVRAKSIALSQCFIEQVACKLPDLVLASPADSAQRGSHISYYYDEGYAVIQALIAANIIADFRAPNMMRFGFAPLYLDERQIIAAVDALADIIHHRRWDQPKFKAKAKVT
ncbi:MAG: kynureninase [Alphaproteobacteria bacterium]